MRKCLLLAAAVAVAGLAPMASAQYMYLDANGNGVHDVGDKMQINGTPTTVDIWLDTNHNRDGSAATCDTGDGPLTMISYAINLLAVNGTVTYSGFINQQGVALPNHLGVQLNDNTNFKDAYGGSIAQPEALYKIATITITGLTGSPHVAIADQVTGSQDYTSFGCNCSGNDFDNTYKLTGPAGGTDWHDVDGVGAADGTATNATTWGKIKELYR